MKKYTKAFKALGDETRLRILKILLHAKHELCVCEISDSLRIPEYSVSRHMKELNNAGLVQERRDGRFIFFSICWDSTVFTKNILDAVDTIPSSARDINNLKKRVTLNSIRKNCTEKKE